MLIVNQDKSDIINVNRITEIKVDEAYICVADRIEQQYGYIIASYKTEERAKEVLLEIVEAYKKYRTAECDGYIKALKETAVYEMPKE